MGSPLFVCGTCPQSDLPVGMAYIGDSFATRFRTVLPCVMADLTFSQAQSLCRSGSKGRDSVMLPTRGLSNADRAIIHLGSNVPV